ncbi:hypothetical protein EBU99_02025 [bacterium]|nr:hypothetical protein [bacterium]
MELSQDMRDELKAESAELVERLAKVWMEMNKALENGQALSRSEIDELFRILHSLKGLSEIAELPRLVSALHLIEDRLTQVRASLSVLELKDLETLAEVQLLLEKIFIAPAGVNDESLLADLEFQAQVFCAGSIFEESQEKHSAHKEQKAFATCLSLTSSERTAWESYSNRSEFIFGFTSTAPLEGIRDRILSIGDILVERTLPNSFLMTFASELDHSLVEQIVEGPVRLLQKQIDSLASLGSPWENLLNPSESSVQAEALEGHLVAAQEDAQVVVENNESHADFFEVAESVSLSDADPEMVADFLNNADELLDSLTNSLLKLEKNPSDSRPIESIFRAAHTIKGTAGMLGFSSIEHLCHALENTFDRMRKGQLSASSKLIDTLLAGWDKVRELFEMLRSGKVPTLNLTPYLQQLSNAEKGVEAVGSDFSHSIPQASEQAQISPESGSELQSKPQALELQKAVPVADKEISHQAASGKGEASKGDTQGTIRVDLKRLDCLVNLVGELVIDRTRFARIEEALRTRAANSDLSHEMAESVLLFGRHMNEVQNIIMKVRMIPVGNVFYKFSRVVRDLSRQCGKEVELVIEGGETEFDKTLVEEIGDPLVHLIRNSIDHGIETPEQREAAGKSRKGQIRLSASQQGNTISISVEDDGKGLDIERIRAKAIKNGLISESAQLSHSEIFNLIFEPGFSTAEKVTNISGRGVGMDVVKKNIQKLKGVVDLDSTPGVGTKTIIKLPITLAIVPSLMVEVSGECFGIPLVNVIESIRISPDDIQRMGQSQFVKLRDQVVPLVRFSEVLGLSEIESTFWYRSANRSSTLSRRRERLVFVVVGIGHERLGLVVDRLIGQQEIVIKPLGRLMNNQPELAGGCVLGDGRVALVLDVAHVIGADSSQRGGHARRSA